ncbi:MAG TPA: hypothetical protein VJO33_03440 [Gemmatimonadaceae bacterium]|nr:hypothetical protein [Gemmatimonadaceae bacterium]
MYGSTRSNRREVWVFVALVLDLPRETTQLHNRGANFAHAAPHYRHAKDHFSPTSRTFHNRVADFRVADEQNAFSDAHMLTRDAYFHDDGRDHDWGERHFVHALRDHRKRVSNWPFLIQSNRAAEHH